MKKRKVYSSEDVLLSYLHYNNQINTEFMLNYYDYTEEEYFSDIFE